MKINICGLHRNQIRKHKTDYLLSGSLKPSASSRDSCANINQGCHSISGFILEDFMDHIVILSQQDCPGLSEILNKLLYSGMACREDNASGKIYFKDLEFYFVEHSTLIKI